MTGFNSETGICFRSIYGLMMMIDCLFIGVEAADVSKRNNGKGMGNREDEEMEKISRW